MFYFHSFFLFFFFFNDTATTEIYTLSLHDALPICVDLLSQYQHGLQHRARARPRLRRRAGGGAAEDRKSTRLNSSHVSISYAVFCLKKKKTKQTTTKVTKHELDGR